MQHSKVPVRCRPALMLAVAGAMALAPVLTAGDGQAAYSKRVQVACKGDYKRLCPSYKAGSLQLRACMEARASEISSGCIDALIDSGEIYKQRVKR